MPKTREKAAATLQRLQYPDKASSENSQAQAEIEQLHIKAMRQTLADLLEDWEQLAGDGVEVNHPDFIVRARSILGMGGAQ